VSIKFRHVISSVNFSIAIDWM